MHTQKVIIIFCRPATCSKIKYDMNITMVSMVGGGGGGLDGGSRIWYSIKNIGAYS